MVIIPVLTKLDEASTAYQRKDYLTAICLCETVLPALEQAIESEDSTAPAWLEQALSYIEGSLPYGLALWRRRQTSRTEAVYLRAMELISPLIDNSCYPIRYRARLVTSYRLVFLTVSTLYESCGNLDRLRQYVKEHQLMLTRWAWSLQTLTHSGSVNN